MNPRCNGIAGFSLLEVMVALAIVALSLTVVSQAQMNAVGAVARSKKLTIATNLARLKMIEIEDQLFDPDPTEAGFDDSAGSREEKGDFDDQGFEDFKYKAVIDKVELPTKVDPEAVKDAATQQGEDGSKGVGAGMFAMGAQVMQQQFEMFRNVLEQSIRRVRLKVSWKTGRTERYISVTAYFTDSSKIEAAGGGIEALKQLAGQKGTDPSASPSTTPPSGTQPSGTRPPLSPAPPRVR